MTTNRYPIPGFSSAAEYQVSGIPFVTSSFNVDTSVQRMDFAYVTRDITVDVSGSAPLRIGFTSLGVSGAVTNNYFIVRPNTTVTFDVRVKQIFFRADTGTTGFSLLAGLTTIPAYQMGLLSGSIVTGSYGWPGVG